MLKFGAAGGIALVMLLWLMVLCYVPRLVRCTVVSA